jgi:hypothetical protein
VKDLCPDLYGEFGGVCDNPASFPAGIPVVSEKYL